jgi:hypothetical protein
MDHTSLLNRFNLIKSHLDERSLRLWVATEALSIGYGGISQVSKITGIARNTISQGCKELQYHSTYEQSTEQRRIRKEGGGRKLLTVLDETLIRDLELLVGPTTRGDPENSLLWTIKSVRQIANELTQKGHKISFRSVSSLLRQKGYSLQSNRKRHEGDTHEDRDDQFNYINKNIREFILTGQPVISVDAKKKELIGNLKNNGKEWHLKGEPDDVNVYDFPSLYEKAIPYGIYDINNNLGWVNVGIDADTASFAVESIRNWWHHMGSQLYPNASQLMITADCGGSNGYRIRLWKKELQRFADEEQIAIRVCHLPPGTSKWNKIEHRLFSFISINWRGKPLISYEVIINLIASTKTDNGLLVGAKLDQNNYPRGIKISDKELEMINIDRDDFHGEWNYWINPNF